MSQLIVSSSPHFRKKRSTPDVMRDVIIALLPTAIAAVVLFGASALIRILVCVLSCVLFEFLYTKLMKLPNTTRDLSAVVTALLLAFSLPSRLPIWMAVIGCFVAIILVKQLFGGLGRNFANPALVGRIALTLSFTGAMSSYRNALDGVAKATPLTASAPPGTMDLFLGTISGSIGEVCKLTLLIGFAYLVIRKVITITIPLSFLGSMAIFALLFGQNPLFHILTGGAIIGAVFMATDFVTSPGTEKGKLIYGIACGFVTMLIRVFGSYPEGVSFAILLMNILTPLIDNYTTTKPLGGAETNE